MSRHGSFSYFLGFARRPFCPVASFCALVTFLFTLPPHWHVFIDTLCLLYLCFCSCHRLDILWRIVGFVVLLLNFLYRHRVPVLLVVCHPMALSSYHCIAFLVVYLPGSFLLA